MIAITRIKPRWEPLVILAAGIVDLHWRRNVLVDKSVVDNSEEEELEAYTIEHVAGPLILLGVGLVLSMILFLLETSHFNFPHLCKLSRI